MSMVIGLTMRLMLTMTMVMMFSTTRKMVMQTIMATKIPLITVMIVIILINARDHENNQLDFSISPRF